jgi:translation elongation factor EF-Tu-like GTPase
MATHGPRRLILARLRLLPAEEGGRKEPVFSDYRPHWNIGNTFEGEPELNDARVFLEDRERLYPGEECVVRIEPLFAERWMHVNAGMQLPMHEGSRIYGMATVLEVIDVD